jgi:hypothetical protein
LAERVQSQVLGTPGQAVLDLLISSRFAEPVIANCPGVLLRSTRSLISVISSGTRWISSIATGVSRVAMNPAGSAVAAVRTA